MSAASAAAKVRRGAERRAFIPLLSKPVIDEYRAVLLDEAIAERFPEIDRRLVDVTIRRLRFVGDYVRSPRARFVLRRDPRDAKFVELAIGLKATHIISSDQDLLSLSFERGETEKRFRQRLPGVRVVDPAEFVKRHGAELNLT